MPIVIPIIAAYAAGTAMVAGTISAFAAFATIAGSAMAVMGAVTKDKDLSRIGMYLSLAGGVSSLASGASSGAASAGTSNIDAAATAGDYVNAADAASDAASAASGSTSIAPPATTPTTAIGGPSFTTPADAPIQAPATTTPMPVEAAGYDFGAGNGGYDFGAGTGAPTAPTGGLMDAAGTTPNGGLMQQAQAPYMQAPAEVAPQATPTASTAIKPTDSVGDAGKALKMSDLEAFYNKAKTAAGDLGSWMQKNPELLKVGGGMLSNMYGPQAERLDMEKSLMERARANLNNPVKLSFNKGA